LLQIVPGIQNEVAEVRNMAMQALGLCCYLSKDLLVTYIPLFMQVMIVFNTCTQFQTHMLMSFETSMGLNTNLNLGLHWKHLICKYLL